MLRLFFYFNGLHLRVRPALPHETMKNPRRWGGIEFEITQSPYMMMIWTSLLPDLAPEDAQLLLNLIGARYPLSPHFQSLKEECPEIIFQSGEEWLFFGGTFNPWHSGHQSCLNLVPEGKICLIIPDRNPNKQLRELNPISTILELSSKIRFKKNQYLVPTFLLDKKKNPTVDWIEKLKREYPDKKYSLLIGFDSFSQIMKWNRSKDLLVALHKLYVVSRLETDHTRAIPASEIQAAAPHLEIEFLGHHEFEDISSTALRKNQKLT